MKKYINILSKFFILIFGIIIYVYNKKNNEKIYQSYVAIYCVSSGFISYFLSKIISLFSNNYKSSDLLINNITQNIDNNGYSVLDERYEKIKVNNLYNLVNEIKCFSRNDLSESKKLFKDHDVKFPTYSYSEVDLISQKCVLDIITDNKFLDIAQNYLKCTPVLTSVNMWWSTDYLKKPHSEAAQMFHFDLDRIKWLKFFIYLTDVNEDNGPHVYIEKTHKAFSKPYKFMLKGYQRIDDKEIYDSYGNDRIKKIIGKAGTVIIGNTSCYHKGIPPKNGNRLIFEFELSNSMFGAPDSNKLSTLNHNEIFQNYKNNNPSLFLKY